jgi:hypothetical protein
METLIKDLLVFFWSQRTLKVAQCKMDFVQK